MSTVGVKGLFFSLKSAERTIRTLVTNLTHQHDILTHPRLCFDHWCLSFRPQTDCS